MKFYTHVSDRYAPFYTKVIAANASEAAHVLDGLMHHESSIDIREHYTCEFRRNPATDSDLKPAAVPI